MVVVEISKQTNGTKAAELLEQLAERPKLAGAGFVDHGETVEVTILEHGLSVEDARDLVASEVEAIDGSFHLLVVRG